ncbi:phytase [Henriciella sp.]|uniref:phytase n=1 Tax=Henriciella sp. TaxID=1968823 RepID=UPI00262C06B7|nr:phytase [Henriciella sp.]
MRVMLMGLSGLTLAVMSGACATSRYDGPQGVDAIGDPAVPVMAKAETVVTTNPAVDADDPALWASSDDPSRGLILATDKTEGLYVHDLDGNVRQFLASGPLNNVDLREGFTVNGAGRVLVGATNDREGGLGINLYLLDPATLEVSDYGFIPTRIGEPYGFCMGKRGQDFFLIATTKAGTVHQWQVVAGESGPEIGQERRLELETQLEGCVVDEAADALYVGEEDAAIWRFDFDPEGSQEPELIAEVDYERFKDDIEGLTIIRDGRQSYLIASSQGDSTFPVYRITGETPAYLGRFTIVESEATDAVTHTDGLDAWSGAIGDYPEGALAIHDDYETPGEEQQNYKLVDWRDVRAALGL